MKTINFSKKTAMTYAVFVLILLPLLSFGQGALFTSRNLSVGSRGEDVRQLQQLLNRSADTQVNITGRPGGPGSETSYFGPLTRAAVIRFQNKYSGQILLPIGLSFGTGFVGPMTRGTLNNIFASGMPGTGGTGGPIITPRQGIALTIAPAPQPVPSLAPAGAIRVPFTNFSLTAGTGGDITVNSIAIERTGFAQDAVFSGIVLLDENGNQLGIARTLNSNHQAIIGEPFVIRAGQVKDLTVAANMSTNLSAYSGQVASLSVVSVNTNVPVTGSLPITGALRTINSTLSLGTASMAVSSFDPNTSTSQPIGTSGYRFSGVRITAGSAENIRLWSIRWNQTGSASSNDMSNMRTYVDGIAYNTAVSPDGKYFTANFPNGILIGRGLSKDIYLQGDITGGGAAGRTIKFDIFRNTDIYITGETYGYGVTPLNPNGSSSVSDPDGASSAFVGTTQSPGTPFFSGSRVAISAGSVTTVSRALSVPAQNIALNVPNQTLGGFNTNIVGEPLSVQQMTFHIAVSQGPSGGGTFPSGYLLSNVTLATPGGVIVAGPVDAVLDTAPGSTEKVTFSDTVTLPLGVSTLVLRGQVPATVADRTTFTVSTAPPTDWSNVTGQFTGNRISLSGISSFSMNTMTVTSGSFSVFVSPSPPAQTVVPGTSGRTLANFQFSTSASGEALRINSVPIRYSHSGAGDVVSSCVLYDQNGNPLNTGPNTINPASGHSSGSTLTFVLNSSFTLPRNTVTILSLQCNVSSNAPQGTTFDFGLSSVITATGLSSGQTFTYAPPTTSGPTITVSSGGGVGIGQEVSAPSYHMAAAGTTETINAIRFTAGAEDTNIKQVGLKLTGNLAENSPANYSSIVLLDPSGNQVGAAFFGGTSQNTIAFLTRDFIIPANTSRSLVIRAQLSQVGPSQPGTEGALLKIDYDNDNPSNTTGVGMFSGSTIVSTVTSPTSSAGVRMFRTIPTITQDSLPNTTIFSGTQALMRFKVSANTNGNLGIYKITLNTATANATVSNVNIYAFTDPGYSQPAGGANSGGALAGNAVDPASGVVEIYPSDLAATLRPFQVPAGGTIYFEVRGTAVAQTSTGSSVSTTLVGDSSYPALASPMGSAAQVDADANDNFIWSPNLNGSSGVADADWTNAFGASFLSANGFTQTISR